MAQLLKWAGQRLAQICLALSALCLLVLMCLTVAEVIGRYGFNAPIFGRQDIAQILLALSIFLAFPVVTLRGEQIDVDLLDSWFSDRGSYWRDLGIALLTSVSLITMGYWLYLRAEKVQSRGITSELLILPKYPLIYFVAFVVLTSGILLAFRAFSALVRKNTE